MSIFNQNQVQNQEFSFRATVKDDISHMLSIICDIDPLHKSFNALPPTAMTGRVRLDKYCTPAELKLAAGDPWTQALSRTARAIFGEKVDPLQDFVPLVFTAMESGLLMPGGRIIAGAGTGNRVTLHNCYVNMTVPDSMEGIMQGLTEAALTMQQGGGIGTDFSTLRPNSARLHRLGPGAQASGPLPFMDMWNAMCKTIMSAGSRRGAMMATISDTHPDLPLFIDAKKTAGRLTMFNMSILVSDAFMQAVQEDEEWVLHFTIPPVTRDLSSNPNLEQYDFEDDDGVQQYVYSVWRARDLWEKITTTTYEYSEPGVIFIDRVNALNNLQYVETIRCTNPCGEQPLPPYGTCNLAHAVLSRMVKNPFTEDAYFDFELLQVVTFLGIRFLDNVIEVTNYPLDLQRDEEFNKRRLGFGVAGLADALAQLGIRYGSIKGAKIAEEIQRTVAIASYEASVALAIERKRFPLFDPKITDCGFIAKKLPSTLRDGIATHGLRNGVLNTIAPTGTTSLAYGNISSGVEPVFAHSMRRRILQPDSSFVNHDEESFIFRFWKHCTGRSLDMSLDSLSSELPDYMITTSKLSVAEHIRMQAACQSWVDASVSKTVNCPEEMTYDEFITVYELAYATGCKGCTTYRPSKVRGSILEDLSKDSQSIGLADTKLRPTDEHPIKERAKRVDVLSGDTYKVRWPSMTAAMYITINKSDDGRPYEMFFASKDARHSDWMTALTLMISGILRSGIDPSFVAEELKQVTSMHDTAWINGKFYASPVAYIGGVIERHLVKDKDRGKDHLEESSPEKPTIPFLNPIQQGSEPKGEMCPKCYAPAVIYAEGCKKCTNCDYTQCG